MSDNEGPDPIPTLDKGKGKMKYGAQLPPELWTRVYDMYYAMVYEEWQSSSRVTSAITPLLVSTFHTGCALKVLYAHPHISERSIDTFIRDVQTPAPYCRMGTKLNSVLHLTVRPSPVDNISSPSSDVLPNINPSLPALTSLFPDLLSLTLRDTLIERFDDALTVFQALSLTKPEKVRLEVRMWRASELARCDEILVSGRPNVPTFPTGPMSSTPRSMCGPTSWAHPLHIQWRDAIYSGTEIEMPLPPDPEDEAARPIRARARLPSPTRAVRAAPNVSGMDGAYLDGTAVVANRVGHDGSPRDFDTLYSLLVAEFVVSSDPTDRVLAYRRLMGAGVPRRSDELLDRQEACRILEGLGFKRLVAIEESGHPTIEVATPQSEAIGGTKKTGLVWRATRPVPESSAEGNDLLNPPANVPQGPGWVQTSASTKTIKHDTASTVAPPSISTDLASPVGALELAVELKEAEDVMLQEGLRVSRAHADVLANQDAGPSASNAAAGPSSEPISSSVGVQEAFRLTPGAHSWLTGSGEPLLPMLDDDQSLQAPGSSGKFAMPAGYIDSEAGSPTTGQSRAAVSRNWTANFAARIARPSAMHTVSSRTVPVIDPEPVDLPTSIRTLLLNLLKGPWALSIKALSFVALDPLASMIARAPRLDFWPKVAVPHIRVHLPRAVNSLAVFMGTRGVSRHRTRQNGETPSVPAARRAAPVLVARRASAPAGITGDVAAPTATLSSNTPVGRTGGTPAPAPRAPVYPDSRPALVTDFIVGGDGYGGDLVHPDNKLFEIEVNTLTEMTDELWILAGSQLPPQVCRILIDSLDWRDVLPRVPETTRTTETLGRYSPVEPSETITHALTPGDYDSASDGEDGDEGVMAGSDDDAHEPGSGYDADAARAQAERLAQRKRDREALERQE